MKRMFSMVPLIAGMLFACSVLKKEHFREKVLNNGRYIEQYKSKDSLLAVHSIFVKDSAQYISIVEILPRGRFHFSPEHGFEGEAEKIQLKRKAHQLIQKQDVLDLRADTKAAGSRRVSERAVSRLNVLAQQKQQNYRLWIFSVVSIGGIYLFWKYVKQR